MPLRGLHILAGGCAAHARIGKLSVQVIRCGDRITNDQWTQYLEGTLKVSAGDLPQASLAYFVDAYPDAAQRKIGVDFMDRHEIPELLRLAIITDSEMVRGALTAYGWLARKVDKKAFPQREYGAALAWLGEAVKFDRAEAEEMWRQAYDAMGLMLPGAKRRGAM